MEERVEALIEAMDRFYGDNGEKDRARFHSTWLLAQTIAEEEGLKDEEKKIAEMASIVFDAAAPLCLSLYGRVEGRMLEVHSREVLEPIFKILGWSKELSSRLIDIISRSHTYSPDDPIEEVVAKEAAIIENLASSDSFDENLALWYGANVFRTKCGKYLLEKLILSMSDKEE